MALEDELDPPPLTTAPAGEVPVTSNGQLGSISLDQPLREARDEFERIYFEYHLVRESHSMTRVSERTGLERTHLYRKLKQLGIESVPQAGRMKILIMGAGRVGTSVAENLVSEENDITVIDSDPSQLQYLQEHFDLRVVHGDGAQVSVLETAGAADTDLFIACAASDTANMVACKIARQLFNIPRRIARIRSAEFPEHPELMSDEGFCIDALISPERSVTTYLHSLIEFPEALQVVEFAEGRVSVVTVRVGHGSPMAHHSIDKLREVWPDVTARVIDVLRGGRPVRGGSGTVIAPGDEVVLLVDTRHARRAVRQLREAEKAAPRHDRRRRQHRPAAGAPAGRRELQRAPHRAGPQALRVPGHAAARQRAGAARQRHRRRPARAREHRGHGHLAGADQRRRGQHHVSLLASGWARAR